MQTPTSLLLQSQLYSSYKSNNTLKGLIGITPQCSFIYSLVIHRIHYRKKITRFSGILDLLEPGDSVMAGKGFNIDELLREKELGLNLPPFLQNQAQFSAANVLEKKNYCKAQSTFRKSHPKNKGIPFF